MQISNSLAVKSDTIMFRTFPFHIAYLVKSFGKFRVRDTFKRLGIVVTGFLVWWLMGKLDQYAGGIKKPKDGSAIHLRLVKGDGSSNMKDALFIIPIDILCNELSGAAVGETDCEGL